MRSSLSNTDIFDESDDVPSRLGLMRRARAARKRRGAALVLGLFMIVSLVTLLAVTLDFAHIHVAETELQRAADASAMAA